MYVSPLERGGPPCGTGCVSSAAKSNNTPLNPLSRGDFEVTRIDQNSWSKGLPNGDFDIHKDVGIVSQYNLTLSGVEGYSPPRSHFYLDIFSKSVI